MTARRPWRAARAFAVALTLAGATAVSAETFDWDALGREFCTRTAAGDLSAASELISASLLQEIRFAYGIAGEEPPPTLFQSYANAAPECRARTRNAALIEVMRSGPGGAPPSWTEYLVVVPEADGTTRIDDVLFATRRSDTLRARLKAIAGR